MRKWYFFDGEKFPLYKKRIFHKIQWVDFRGEYYGLHVFTFDGDTFFNMYRDYPENLTEEQKKIFDKENPFWAKYFSKR